MLMRTKQLRDRPPVLNASDVHGLMDMFAATLRKKCWDRGLKSR